ncbi:hypothetical protein, partial [Streptomyces sp. MI02-7b]|uniref:hypothetical protein n=1 Tax=Streptomyces sp. MI02-7b TaxID=462941 RepID=UPI0029A01FB7
PRRHRGWRHQSSTASTDQGVLSTPATFVANALGIQPQSALRYIEPAAVADQIAEASAIGTEGADSVHGVQPVRIDDRTAPVPRWICSRPLMALAQAVKC